MSHNSSRLHFLQAIYIEFISKLFKEKFKKDLDFFFFVFLFYDGKIPI